MIYHFKLIVVPLTFLSFLFLFTNGAATATVQWEVLNTLAMEGVPLDLEFSSDGKQIFVLTQDGDILIYSSGSTLKHKIHVGPSFDRFEIGPQDVILILSSRTNKKVQLIRYDVIQDINVSGSPFQGSKEALVVIAVFSDFQ